MISSPWCPVHAHAGLGVSIVSAPAFDRSSPRACGLGGGNAEAFLTTGVQPTRMRAWGLLSRFAVQLDGPAHAHAGLG